MKLITTKQIIHKSPISKINNTPPVIEILTDLLHKKGEYNIKNLHFLDSDTIELNNISSTTLHSFVLALESLGKKITFEKSTIISIDE